MTAHTPGPWRVVRANPGPTTGEWMIAGSKAGYIVEVRDCGGGSAEANARLIAAAPDLLEALQFVMSAHGEQLDTAFRQAHAAIAKATVT